MAFQFLQGRLAVLLVLQKRLREVQGMVKQAKGREEQACKQLQQKQVVIRRLRAFLKSSLQSSVSVCVTACNWSSVSFALPPSHNPS